MVHARFIVGDVPVSPDIRGCVHDLYANRLCPCGCGSTYHGSGGTEPEPALALAILRRARDGQHAWTLDLGALRHSSRRPQGEVVRALIPALEHHAAIAVRCTAAGKIQADRWHWRYAARLQGEETVSGEPGAQRNQREATGHSAVLPQAWDEKSESPSDTAQYYGGYKQADVKPSPDSPLQKLGIEKVQPIITSAVLLYAKTYLGHGSPMQPGQAVTAADVEAMLKAQGLEKRGLMPGDVLYIYTGWGDNWKDPDTEKFYYTKGPGLAYDGAKYIEQKAVVLPGLDNPFTDPVADGFLQGKAPPPSGAPAGLPFAIHHTNLAESGIYQIQNANLGALAQDKVWVSCTMILPLRAQGNAGSPVRPVAIGVPAQ